MPQLITADGPFDELIDRLVEVDRYAIDTEFLRERTYWPDLALIQVAWPATSADEDAVALIDPTAVDLGPLRRLLAGPGVLVAHAADQDLEVLAQACSQRPTTLFDTQIAAGFLGQGSASLASLASTFLHLKLPKADRLTDWSVRPLSEGQLSYAAADVAHLLELADVISSELEDRGRLAWADEECEIVRLRASGPNEPARAWWRLREARQLRGPARGVAQEVAAWREQRGREVNQPVRFVLPDLALQAIVHGQPQSVGALRGIRVSTAGTYGARSRARSSMPSAGGGSCPRLSCACRRPTTSTGIGGRRSPWPRPGWRSWPATSESTLRCWPPGVTWSPT